MTIMTIETFPKQKSHGLAVQPFQKNESAWLLKKNWTRLNLKLNVSEICITNMEAR